MKDIIERKVEEFRALNTWTFVSKETGQVDYQALDTICRAFRQILTEVVEETEKRARADGVFAINKHLVEHGIIIDQKVLNSLLTPPLTKEEV